MKPLAVYDCAIPEPSRQLELRHTWGCQVIDPKSSTGNAWEYRPVRIERPGERITGEHTIYGPYVNDFGKPGFYRVRFRIRGNDLPRTDERVMALDVVQSRFGTDAILRLLGQKVVRARDMRNSYRYFDIECYASGTGVYEYRCTVLKDASALKVGRILFDNIKVYSNPPIWEAL
ncbi:MAG: hypothetical protein ACLP7O_03710 [Terracidiphilus sp.]